MTMKMIAKTHTQKAVGDRRDEDVGGPNGKDTLVASITPSRGGFAGVGSSRCGCYPGSTGLRLHRPRPRHGQ